MHGELLVAQVTDTHIGSADERPAGVNLERLDRVLNRLSALARRPDILLVTGDLADRDEEAPYRLLKERLERCPFPAHVAIGNHDSREAARAVFGGGDVPFFHYVVDAGPLRLIMLDTVEPGRHGGAFCEVRSAWLRNRLAEAPERPTLVALHHPPFATGIDWLTTAPGEPWVARLEAALTGRRQVVALVAGHVHRTIAASLSGIPVLVCPPVAAPLALDLAPLDPERPDGRPLVVDGPPGYTLHLWHGGRLVTHVDFVEEPPVLARFDERMQRLIRKLFAERPR
jgi:3',5'-cyclic AMP phosphodiesterase CpdA